MSCVYLNHDANDTLDAHNENRFRTLLGRVSVSVTDSVLSFDTEEKRRCESVDVANAGFPTGIRLFICRIESEMADEMVKLCFSHRADTPKTLFRLMEMDGCMR